MVRLSDEEKRQAVAEKHLDTVSAEEAKTVKKEEKKKEVKAAPAQKADLSLEDLGIILHPLVTEKAVNMIEAENKITFVVNDEASKQTVKKILEKAYGIKINKINIVRDMKGRKKAIVRLNKAFKAQDLATRLGVL